MRLERIARSIGLFVFALSIVLWGTVGTVGATGRHAGFVYALTNATSNNAVAVFGRDARGALTPLGEVATGGAGTGSGLGSQGALVLSNSGRWLFAVNAASNDVSVFQVRGDSLRLTDKVASGGEKPISLTYLNHVLYVLNAGGSGNISGFAFADGHLTAIGGSTQPLSGTAVAPAQVQFSRDGDTLVVTEKATNLISVYAVDTHGVAHGPTSYPSAGKTPFGFAFGRRDQLIVSEAFGGAANASAVSLYRLKDGELETRTPSAPTNQTAACWVVVTNDGRYAYTTNAGSASISGYTVGRDGTLTLLNANGVTASTGANPIDMAISRDGRLLYALNSGSNSISGFQIKNDGSLRAVGTADGLPAGAVGLAAR